MNEIKDKKLREMLDEAGLADITVFRKDNHVIVKKGDEFVAACEAAYRDVSRERWIETIRHWLDTDERFCKKEPLTDEQMAVECASGKTGDAYLASKEAALEMTEYKGRQWKERITTVLENQKKRLLAERFKERRYLRKEDVAAQKALTGAMNELLGMDN